ncbi:MAG: hypothetical protein CSA74_01090 [Rhodobacterales bacterium]|nr:MAG: hypothetical protein CSA74_01090 [Rhodobacterales bacterium]
MDHRVLEIRYDTAAIPGGNPHDPADPHLLRFRDMAMQQIGAALGDDGLGAELGAVVEQNGVRLKFMVMDFDAAEARLGAALGRSGLGKPVEILRYWDDKALI